MESLSSAIVYLSRMYKQECGTSKRPLSHKASLIDTYSCLTKAPPQIQTYHESNSQKFNMSKRPSPSHRDINPSPKKQTTLYAYFSKLSSSFQGATSIVQGIQDQLQSHQRVLAPTAMIQIPFTIQVDH